MFLTSPLIDQAITLIDPPPMVGLFAFVGGVGLRRMPSPAREGVNTRSVTLFPLRGPQTMANLSSLVKQLKKERDRVAKQLSGMDAALRAFAGVYGGTVKATSKRRKMSVAARKKIAAAQRRRWAKFRAKRK
jgi:hypothetical protein